jgi:hypothetical protein
MMASAFRCGCALAVAISLSRCDYVQGTRQVRTTADLQTISARIDGSRNRDATVQELETLVASSVRSVHKGRDAWGHEYLWRVRANAGHVSYIVLSPGSDGRPDLPAIDEYFSKKGLTVLRASNHERDIVFRDGEAVVTGGK